jgi:hypothetical protein
MSDCFIVLSCCKWLAGVIGLWLLAMTVAPGTGEYRAAGEGWLRENRRWLREFQPRYGQTAEINPRRLYGGIGASILAVVFDIAATFAH